MIAIDSKNDGHMDGANGIRTDIFEKFTFIRIEIYEQYKILILSGSNG